MSGASSGVAESGVVELHGKQHHINRPDLGRVVGRDDVLEVEIAVRTLDPQSVRAERLQVGAACEEGDVGAGLREPAAEVPAEPAAADDGDAHSAFYNSRPLTRGWPRPGPR